MIKLIRVDYRLIHGQVAVSWTASLGADAILLVSDTLQNDTIRKETLLLAKPSNVKLVAKDTQGAIDILKSGKTDHYKVFVVCETLEIADKVAGTALAANAQGEDEIKNTILRYKVTFQLHPKTVGPKTNINGKIINTKVTYLGSNLFMVVAVLLKFFCD